MRIHRPALAALASLGLFAALDAPAHAQLLYGTQALRESVSWTWGENVGFVTFRRTAGFCNNVILRPGLYMEGSAWGENIGWISFGRRPFNNVSYANAVVNTPGGPVLDYGVNVVFDGVQTDSFNLSGWAWGENIGWINFDAASTTTPPNPARYDANGRRLRGYAWGENIGWINFDSQTTVIVSYICRTDYDQNGVIGIDDLFLYLDGWFANNPNADFDCNGIRLDSIFLFLQAWFAGC